MSKNKNTIQIQDDENLEFPNMEMSDDIITPDDDVMDITIEVSDDIDDIIESDVVPPIEDVVLSKHKIEGKHSLKYDSIFKGKKEEIIDEDDDSSSTYFNENFDVDKSSVYWGESQDNESYIRQKRVKERVYDVLSEKTEINFMSDRRKPSKIDFNNYYLLLTKELESERFTHTELFNELSVYFSDNLFILFKLLDNRWRTLIIEELQDHIGRNKNSKQISNRNIYEGTEIEFIHQDILGEDRLYTGVVVETDYPNSNFRIDSYENVYSVHISKITKILNNTKFKHNLNKLNNIDFL
jgi:hypothetical protein